MRILAPFCSFYAFHRPCSYSLVSLVQILALSVLLMDCIDLSLTRNSHCWESQLHFALFIHSTDLGLTHVIGADLRSICLLVLSIPQTLLSLFFVIVVHPTSFPAFLCILRTLLSFSTFIFANWNSILPFLYTA